MTSTPLRIEKPVRRPRVPPIRLRADSIDTWQEIYFSFYVKILEFKHYLHIPRDLIVGGRVKENVDKNQVRVFFHIGIVVDDIFPQRDINFFIPVLIEFYVFCKRLLIAVVTFLDDIKNLIIFAFMLPYPFIFAFMLNIHIKTTARDVAGKDVILYFFITRALTWSAEVADLEKKKE